MFPSGNHNQHIQPRSSPARGAAGQDDWKRAVSRKSSNMMFSTSAGNESPLSQGTTSTEEDSIGYRDLMHLRPPGYISEEENDGRWFTGSAEGQHTAARSATFPVKLHGLLSRSDVEKDLQSIVSWEAHGRSFAIHHIDKFKQLVMPRFFGDIKWESFMRQINMYGFQRITRCGPDKGGYFHEKFLRGRLFLAWEIHRNRVKGTGRRAKADPDSDPDFWRMPWLEKKALQSLPAARAQAEPEDAKSGFSDIQATHQRFPPSHYAATTFGTSVQPEPENEDCMELDVHSQDGSIQVRQLPRRSYVLDFGSKVEEETDASIWTSFGVDRQEPIASPVQSAQSYSSTSQPCDYAPSHQVSSSGAKVQPTTQNSQQAFHPDSCHSRRRSQMSRRSLPMDQVRTDIDITTQRAQQVLSATTQRSQQMLSAPTAQSGDAESKGRLRHRSLPLKRTRRLDIDSDFLQVCSLSRGMRKRTEPRVYGFGGMQHRPELHSKGTPAKKARTDHAGKAGSVSTQSESKTADVAVLAGEHQAGRLLGAVKIKKEDKMSMWYFRTSSIALPPAGEKGLLGMSPITVDRFSTDRGVSPPVCRRFSEGVLRRPTESPEQSWTTSDSDAGLGLAVVTPPTFKSTKLIACYSSMEGDRCAESGDAEDETLKTDLLRVSDGSVEEPFDLVADQSRLMTTVGTTSQSHLLYPSDSVVGTIWDHLSNCQLADASESVESGDSSLKLPEFTDKPIPSAFPVPAQAATGRVPCLSNPTASERALPLASALPDIVHSTDPIRLDSPLSWNAEDAEWVRSLLSDGEKEPDGDCDTN